MEDTSLNRRTALLGLALAGVIGACTSGYPDSGWTVETYRADPAQRASTLARCANDPGRLSATPECRNAQAAARIDSVGSLRDLPPLPLSVEDAPLTATAPGPLTKAF